MHLSVCKLPNYYNLVTVTPYGRTSVTCTYKYGVLIQLNPSPSVDNDMQSSQAEVGIGQFN